MTKILAAINAGLVVLEGAVNQLPVADAIQIAIAVAAAIGIAMISTYIGPITVKNFARALSYTDGRKGIILMAGQKTVSVNEGVDLIVDSAQNFKNFVNKAFDTVVEGGVETKNDINDLLDQLINKMQEMKG